uniref:Putative toxin-antitoxin system toxin component, PIN family n=1 Tax=Candidatus Kentrum sp. FM TaxID=2126340 RepID=A0A450VSG5_9GAMM|nr:MAG: putative toxin-antitoxin system toxin component, PIN family [Candidatus Kentron sp. FM]VFJ52371.1 MAG: putative toxin-antitoxin system toxin component, PIN family [Candidatus Kentron sp. FM]VFK07717.1 MAG: putative toxin-antitoxin system toxin component, PIN family [Candidatus Kentron sp. FM]
MRVVIDTNTLAGALLLKHSVPRQAFDKAMVQGSVLLSTATLDELNEVLSRKKFGKYISDAERILFAETLVQQSLLISPTGKIDACRDPKDNKFLDLAVSGKADCLISGDDDLLMLNPFEGIPILCARDFLEME